MTDPIELVLVGNKIDLGNRMVSKAEGQKVAEGYNAKYYETSCQTGENVEDMFADLFYNALALKFEEYVEDLGAAAANAGPDPAAVMPS